MVQVDIVDELGPPTLVRWNPPRMQVMLFTYHDRETYSGNRMVARWLLHIDGRVFHYEPGDRDPMELASTYDHRSR